MTYAEFNLLPHFFVGLIDFCTRNIPFHSSRHHKILRDLSPRAPFCRTTFQTPEKERKRKENCASRKKAAHINKGKGTTWEEKPLHQRRKGWSVRIRRVASRQASRTLLISLKVSRMPEGSLSKSPLSGAQHFNMAF